MGLGVTIAGEYYKGLGQGVLNVVNGVQDIAVGTANFAVNTSPAGMLIDVPQLESSDWSRGMLVHESDATHGWSKFIGGESAVTLMTLGAGQALKAARINCFVAGTEVHMDDAIEPPKAADTASLALAATCVPVALAGYAISRRKKKSRQENANDDYFAEYEPELL
ncbi:MAG: hypothetical protein H8E66_14720 [Planctomycetes bacterium]|nr:hypothetical protein [Planctomycetota bacterium]